MDHRRDLPLTCVASCHGAHAGDLALGIEDGIDAFDGFQRDGRDIFGDPFALPGGGLDVGQFEELPPGVAPAERAEHRRGFAGRIVNAVIAAIGVGLQDAGPARQMPGRMFHSAVGREVIERCRWCPTCKGPVIPQVSPEPSRLRPTLGHQRHGRVIGVQSFCTENMGADQIVDRLQRGGAGPDLVGQGGKADLDALLGIPLSLSVQGLVLPELLEEQHCQQVGASPAPRCGVEGGRRLADLLAVAAGELLADGLDHLPLPGNDLQRLGDVLAHLHDAPRSATAAGGRGFDHHALPGQMLGERLAGWTAAFESRNRGLRRGGIRLCPILPKVRLQILELHLELFNQPDMAFGAVPELLAAEFGDLELQVPDHRIGGGNDRARLCQLFLCRGCTRFCRSEGSTQDSDL